MSLTKHICLWSRTILKDTTCVSLIELHKPEKEFLEKGMYTNLHLTNSHKSTATLPHIYDGFFPIFIFQNGNPSQFTSYQDFFS